MPSQLASTALFVWMSAFIEVHAPEGHILRMQLEV